VKAEVTISGTTSSVTRDVSFGNGPLSVFNAPVGTASPYLAWDQAYQICNGSPYTGDYSTGWSSGAYVGGGKMPTRAEYQAVSPYNVPSMWPIENPNSAAQGAAVAAGWPTGGPYYWTGEASNPGYAFYVRLHDGYGGSINLDPSFGAKYPVACRR
jgi:hypothetical protein